jgi:hypothetical protein
MAKKAKRPSLFESPQRSKQIMKNVGASLTNKVLDGTMQDIVAAQPQDFSAQRMPKYLKLTQERMDKLGVIDLKPFFRRSSKAKGKADGGWYMVVPIRRKARDMSRRMYEQLRAIDIGPNTSQTIISDYLYDRRAQSDASMLNYTPRSNNITKIVSGKNRHDYIAFRTVSDKSPASSWILNRDKVNSDDTSKTFIRNVNRLMKWRMKNL